MTDWSKLKVVDLRQELKARGLPQTGLKPALVARLTEAEAEAEPGDGSESDATVQGDAAKLDTASPETFSPTRPATDLSAELPTPPQTLPEPQASASQSDAIEPPTSQNQSESPTAAPLLASRITSNDSSLPPLESQEVLGDLQKRKRRSQSPVPSSADIAHKRARQDDVEMSDGVVATKADAVWVGKHNAVDAAEVNAESMEIEPAREGTEPGPTMVDATMEGMMVEDMSVREKDTQIKLQGDSKEPFDESPSRMRDSRFKELFSAPQVSALEQLKSENSEMPDVEPDRTISPAIHPATAALYIRDMMRPLNPAQLKSHLVALATPPGQDLDSDIVINFYLDPIRTHAFVSLKNISAASRIRSALHDRTWPDERNRKPLWVDFVPLEKVEEWIKEEDFSQPGGRGLAKKWEVVYDIAEDRQVTAHLQEVNSIASRSQPVRQPSITTPLQEPLPQKSIAGAPLGPRADLERPSIPIVDTEELDHLFQFTMAGPKLYFKPVDKELANKRLDRMEDITSKNYDYDCKAAPGEINRYTLEDDSLVDRGPEIFPGLRPPRGFRGPVFSGGRPRGGFAGRGGGGGGGRGYGGGFPDTYRGPGGDGYRGDAYGSDRRYRDDRRY